MSYTTLKTIDAKLDEIIRLFTAAAVADPDWPKVVADDTELVQFEELSEIATKLFGAGKIEEAKALLINKYGYDTVDSADESQYPAIKKDLLELLEE